MAILLPIYLLVGLYCGAYALHCFQKKHWMQAAAACCLTVLPFLCGFVLFFSE